MLRYSNRRWGGKGLFHLLVLSSQSITEGSQGRRSLQAGTETGTQRLASPGLLSLLSYTTKATCPPTSVITQENTLQTYLQAV